MAINPTHTKLAATATRLINENGSAMKLWREDETGGTSFEPIVTPEDVDITAVRSKFSSFEVGDGSRIKSTDIKLLMDSSVNPKEYQKVIDGVNELQIIDSVVIAPGDVTIIYKVQARL